MPIEFEPMDRIQNILYVIKELTALMHNSDTSFTQLYQDQIEEQFFNLNEAITDMKSKE